MASLALGLVGAGIGSLAPAGFSFLGMSGAGLGWAVGSALGNILFAPDGPNTQGPRLSDLSVQTSTRGAPIPKVYGTSRIAGNVIWTAGIQETATTQDVGGKGGPSASHTTYSYSCSFAVGLCEGEIIGVRRIWADSVLIFERTDAATADQIEASSATSATVYIGSESQDPDPTIEASEGAGNVPGFRGLAYVVFENLQLERFGNRIPNITCEVVAKGSKTPTSWEEVTDHPLSSTSINHIVYAGSSFVAVTSNGKIIYSTDGNSWTEKTNPAATGSLTCLGYSHGKYIAGGVKLIESEDGVTWTEITPAPDGNLYSVEGNGSDKWMLGGKYFSQVFASSQNGHGWTSQTSNINTNEAIRAISYGNSTWVAASDTGSISTSTDASTWTARTSSMSYAIYDAEYGSGWWVAVGGNGHLVKSSDGITWALVTDAIGSTDSIYSVSYGDGLWVIAGSSGKVAISEDLETWESINLDANITVSSAIHTAGVFWAVGSKHGTEPKIFKLNVVNRISSAEESLSDILTDICSDVGISDLDVSGITDTVHGYVRSSRMTARSAIEPLITAYQCGAVESDYKLKFLPLTGAPVDAVSYADMCGELRKSRDVETELPMRVTVSYSDKDSDYLPAVQSDKRIYSSGQIVNEVSAQFAISAAAGAMAKLAQKILYRAWTEREKFDFPLTQKFAYLDAGDVVTINSDTASHVVRITNGQMGLPGLIECSGVATRASLYSSSVSGIASSYASQSLVLVGNTLFEIMDLPALRDADATSAGFYVAVYGERANWSSGIVYRSTDGGSSWSGLVSTSTEATMGVTTDALSDGDHKTWDETSTVNISMYNGTLSSDTTANVLNGANAALIGDELIHFRTATLEGDGTYTLSGLLRGMKGTEHETGTHTIGDRFVLLNTTSIYRVSADYSKLNVTDKFKAVTNGQFLDSVTDTTDVTFTNLNAKPLSPCQIYGTRDGSNNLTINWQRRSRLTETSLDDPGLGEASELYEVHVMSGGVAVRVIQSTTNSASYTVAQQTADGLTPGDPVTVNIYQVSDTVGRGYVRSETI